MTHLPKDQNDNVIPALALRPSGAHQISAAGTAARNSTAFAATTRVVGLYATVPVYIATGGATVTATTSDHYFPAGIYYDIAIGGDVSAHDTHLSALAVSDSGTLYISEKE